MQGFGCGPKTPVFDNRLEHFKLVRFGQIFHNDDICFSLYY